VLVPTRWDGSWQTSWQGSRHKDACRSPPLAIVGNGAGLVSRSVVRKGNFCPNSSEIEKERQVVQHPAIYTAEENQGDGSKPTPGIMRGMLGALTFSPPMPCNAPLTANGGLSPHINNVKSALRGEVARKVSHHAHDLEEWYMAPISSME
jgi:hypothetical protein